MSIIIIGINHKTAPITVREKIYFAVDKQALYLQDLLNRNIAREAVLLSTCNRSELYCEAEDVGAIRDWFCAQADLPRTELEPTLYIHRDTEAVIHIMQVACGLDSMVIGEPQILGQMKEAFSESCTAGAVGTLFHRLFQQIFNTAKQIRTSTAIGACPVSVASAATQFAKQRIQGFSVAKVALIGAGDTTHLLVRYLKMHLTQPMIIVNRSLENAAMLAEAENCDVTSLEQLPFVLGQVDLVFSATGSAVPIVTKAMMAEVMQARRAKPLTLIDIAVPRDIDAAVAEIPGAHLYCIDDLKAIIEQNRQGREHAADKAREMIQQKSQEFIAEMQSFDKVAHTIRAYRGQIEEMCQAELCKAQLQLQQGMNPTEVLNAFANAFVKKLMHAPSVQLRQAGAEGRFELLRFAKQLFAIPDPDIERL